MTTLDHAAGEACTTDRQPLSHEQCRVLLQQLAGWQLTSVDGVAQLNKTYRFANFNQALAFTNRVGQISEAQNHHPALLTEWGQVTVKWWSHSAKGLLHTDFIMAARTDALFPLAPTAPN